MREKLVYVVAAIAAIAVVVVMPPIAFDSSRAAWIVCGIVAFGILISIPVYIFVRERKVKDLPTPSSVPVIGPLIVGYDQAFVFGNEASVNVYPPQAHGELKDKAADE